MNKLTEIRKQIIKKTRLHDAQLNCVVKPCRTKYIKIITE